MGKAKQDVKRRVKQDSGDYSKLPPQAKDLEEAVLGALMIDKEAITVVIEILHVDSFYVDANQAIYSAVCKLFEKSLPIDLLTVQEQLKKDSSFEMIGGAEYLINLTNRVASAANIEYHARIIQQKFLRRELIQSSTRIINGAYEEGTDIIELLDTSEQEIFRVTESSISKGYNPISSVAKEARSQILDMIGKNQEVTGLPSGFTKLDEITSGWQDSDLIIVAARPGMGKTAFALGLARNAAINHGRTVGFFSLEMSELQLTKRLISMEAEISSQRLRKGDLLDVDVTIMEAAIEKISNSSILIDDTPGLGVFELRAKCRRMKARNNLSLIIVDYLQLMTAPSDKYTLREQEISMISRSLKGLAKELNVPVIALSQLNRSVESRGGLKKPMLSDLRESGAIEQDADIVSFIYRPEYYDINEDEEGNSLKGIGEVLIRKHRNGELGDVRLKWISQFAKFTDLEEDLLAGIDISKTKLTSGLSAEDVPF